MSAREQASVSLDICWSCEERRPLIPVMFPASPQPGAPLKEHWWCEECTSCWLGEADIAPIETTGVVEVAAERGYRKEPS